MLKLLLLIAIFGALLYLLVKYCLYLYRPFFLSRTFREIDEMYNRLMTAAEEDLNSMFETLEKWRSNDKVITTEYSEDQIYESINDKKAVKDHEQEVYEKFLRLKERFILKPDKLSESIVAYRRYLMVRLKQRQDSMLFSRAVTIGVMRFDELMAASKETKIAIEEIERKLDILLS